MASEVGKQKAPRPPWRIIASTKRSATCPGPGLCRADGCALRGKSDAPSPLQRSGGKQNQWLG